MKKKCRRTTKEQRESKLKWRSAIKMLKNGERKEQMDEKMNEGTNGQKKERQCK